MPAAALDPKLLKIVEMVNDYSRVVSEIELRRAVREVDAVLERTHDLHLAADLYALRANVYFRLGQLSRAVDDCRLALQRLREPTEDRAIVLTTQGGALVTLGRFREGAVACIEAARIPGHHHAICLANLSEALHRLGDPDTALATFKEAVSLADLSDPAACFKLAAQAAEIALDDEALELFAIYIQKLRGAARGTAPAIDVVRGAAPDERAVLVERPMLDALIRRTMAMVDELERIAAEDAGHGDDPVAQCEAEDVYEATRRLREEALQHATRS